ncbi:translation initiation factor IF-2 [Campylobacter mucosalis]|uniref:Translation initiation factor IF-2 n=1 Tax=Campylobacter mucosalis CCUG 21559 TaxID=1032067 RepID=A0A6G5QFA8_9BACT|nr:translation initiation factor IF-2 [Campylobacter mucosalis]QCD44304.1 translation initiation factor IF-2 [Campylobacter mucosalis CCUG 21559]
MANIRISEIANEIGYPAKEVLEKAQELGLKVKTHSNAVTPEDAEAIYEYITTGVIPDKFQKKKSESKPKKESVKATKDKDTTTSSKKESTKKESKKESKTKEPVKSAQPKNEEPKVVKEEPKQEVAPEPQKPKESLADISLQKRRGLVIVKKKSEDTPPAKSTQASQSEPIIPKNLENMFSNVSDLGAKKKKKDLKKQPVSSKKDSSQKMDFLGGSDFADIVLEDENEVVLPDFSFKTPSYQQEKQNQNTKIQNQVRNVSNNNINIFAEGGLHRRARKKHKKPENKQNSEAVTSVDIPKEIRVYEFAEKLNKQPSEIIGKLFMLGMMTTKNDFLDEDAIEILADEFNVEVNIIDTQEEFDYVKAYEDEQDEHNLTPRVPVITIMGHVDHGKTSLLDYIRKSRVASGEAGGITQHVGAYMVNKNGKNITFIDTPGHEAFTAMRARGAGVTDIVIIVVAADDGVKPQTKEAVAHAKAAGVPIIIAINKMDKENANPDLVKTGLAELDIMPTEWGGANEFVPISAKTGMGIDDLLEIVLLQAEILELKANAKTNAKASVIESSVQKGRGPVATVIVENGTLKVGDTIVAGVAYGRLRTLLDDQGRPLKEIRPGECGVIVGLSEVPEAGETLISVKSDKEAREYASKKAEYLRQKELSKSTKVSIDELSAKIAEGELKTLPVIVKADVQGSLEALKVSLDKLANDEIKVNIIHSGVGGITQNDIALATASSNCVILGFNIRPTGEIKEKAKESGVQIKTYNVIYNLIDDVKALLSGMMSPIIREEQLGQAVVRQVINVPKIGAIAGCLVTEGVISRGAKIRLIRDGVVVQEGTISSLKRFKDDAREVAKGYECGVGIEGYNNIRENDYIESFKEIEEQAKI